AARKRFMDRVEGMDPKAQAIVKWLQPGLSRRSPDDHPLMILSRLSNGDKHGSMIAVVSGVRDLQTRFHRRGRLPTGWVARGLRQDGAIVAEEPFAPADMPEESDVQVEVRGAPVVA